MTSVIMVSPTHRSAEKKQNNEAETSVLERTCVCVCVRCRCEDETMFTPYVMC